MLFAALLDEVNSVFGLAVIGRVRERESERETERERQTERERERERERVSKILASAAQT